MITSMYVCMYVDEALPILSLTHSIYVFTEPDSRRPHNLMRPSPPNHLRIFESPAPPLPPRLRLPLGSSSPPIHLGFLKPSPISWIHLGVSIVSIVFLNRWPRLAKKLSSSCSAGAVAVGCPRLVVFRVGRVCCDGEVANGVLTPSALADGIVRIGCVRPEAPREAASSSRRDIDVPFSSRSMSTRPSRQEPVP